MSGFNNRTFELLVKDLINDTFYATEISNRGKVAKIRQYSEVIVRKILDISNEDYMTIGNKNIQSKIKEQSEKYPFLLEALKNIANLGNDCTHTQVVSEITEEDVNNTINNLFELYSYLLINYFDKYEFGSNPEIVFSFSILPPIIRYITLKYLNEKYPENILIIDKLSLAILKAFDKEKAIDWVEKRKETLIIMPASSTSEEEDRDLEERLGTEVARYIIDNVPNMYDLCNERIEIVGKILEQNGKMYDDFESAVNIYYEKGRVQGQTPDVIEFNSIMEFLYLGRKEQFTEVLKRNNCYMVIDNIF